MTQPWPKDIVCWEDGGKDFGRRQCMSVPFTWLLPRAQRIIDNFPGVWLVGGPAISLMPGYLKGCQIGYQYDGVLQRINPEATRTSAGCPRKCTFCGVKNISGPTLREFAVWPDLPVICDDNLLACTPQHFKEVCRRLERHGWCDFNQGLDCRLLARWHADQIAKIKKPIVRLALDSDDLRDVWATALDYLLTAGCAKRRIRSYVLCGVGTPDADWKRCGFVESFGVMALPMWRHSLGAMRYNEITPTQEINGWTKEEQRRLMRWHYKHAGSKP